MKSEPQDYSMSGAELKSIIEAIDDDDEVVFAVDGLTIQFYRKKIRGEKLWQLEFNEIDHPNFHLRSLYKKMVK